MALINTISVQRKAVAFTELATVLVATEHRIGMDQFNASVRSDMQAAFSDLADAMGFDLVPSEPRRVRPARASQPIGESAAS